MNGEMQQVPLVRVLPSRWQPREPVFDAEKLWDLARSIREMGLINAPVVFPVKLAEDDPEPWYELVAGERRARAVLAIAWAGVDDVAEKEAVETLARAGLAGLPDGARGLLEAARASIDARVEDGEDLARLHRVAVVENLERQSLAPLEEARALQGLAEAHGWSQRELAKSIGKSQSYVAQRLALLGLSEEVQVAISTEVLTPTHARAIARVPEALQPAMAEWAAGAVARDDSPATTRQVQRRASDLAKFVDPDRWLPNGERVYKPVERNALALMRWAVEQADVAKRAEALMGLASVGWEKKNVLGMKPINAIDGHLMSMLDALGWTSRHKEWDLFAAETGRTCEDCVFAPYNGVGGLPHGWGYCERWRDPDLTACRGFIGGDDPVVIPVGNHELRRFLGELGVALVGEPFTHVESVSDYVVGLQQAVALREKQVQEEEAETMRAHLEPIQAFQEWQLEQPDRLLRLFQSHSCTKCAHHRPDQIDEGLPACRFATELLVNRWGSGSRPPEFGVLVTPDGRMLPRCEQFAWKSPGWPQLARMVGVSFGRGWQESIADWLHGLMTSGGGHQRKPAFWGLLRWLDYDRPLDDANDYARLKAWIVRNWEDLGGDEVVATLLVAARSEAKATRTYGTDKPFELFDPTTNRVETFVAVEWEYVVGRAKWNEWKGWPEGWPKPWEDGDG